MSCLKLLTITSLLLYSFNAFSQESCRTERRSFIEKEDVKVWSTTICPNQSLSFHTHDFPRVLISDETGSLKVNYLDGKSSEIQLIKGTPIYLSKAQGLSPHQDLNPGPKPLHLTVIELRSER